MTSRHSLAAPYDGGVDNSPEGMRAAMFAFSEASARNCEVVAIRAWHPQPDPQEELQTAERHELREAMRGARQAYPDLAFTPRVIGERPAAALIEASRQAQLVVVGSRGMSGPHGFFQGSKGLRLPHHAYCPVVIAR